MRYFLELSYNGTSFHGWQIQPNADSVQAVIEEKLSVILRKEIAITGAGRTDTGVHARRMFAHFDTENLIEDKQRFILSLNSMVGKNISIINLYKVNNDAHARFDATHRTYKYFVTFNKNPFLYNLSWFYTSSLDIDKMNEAAQLLLMTRDFTSFAKLHSDNKTNICDVSQAIWKDLREDKEACDFMGNMNQGIVFTITSDRFLRNMVRAVVGTLVEVGRNKMTLSKFKEIIAAKDRCLAGSSMPPQALFLWDIQYPYL